MILQKSYQSESLEPTTLCLPDRSPTKWANEAVEISSISNVIYTHEISFLPYYFVQVKISALLPRGGTIEFTISI